MNNKYIILSSIYSDNITFPDGSKVNHIPGGAGGYALAGVKLWTDDVLIVSGVGKDYSEVFSEWMQKNNLSEDGFVIVDKNSYQNEIVYRTITDRTETPMFGLEHRKKVELDTSILEQFADVNTKGVYTFQDATEDRMQPIIDIKRKYNFKVMWEIAGNTLKPKYIPKIKGYAKDIELFSINYEEATELFEELDVERLTHLLQDLGFEIVAFRLGSKGIRIIDKRGFEFIKSVKNGKVIDVTGCGNSSTAAAMYSFCEGNDLLTIGLHANIAASYVYQQYGPYPLYDIETRDSAKKLLNDLYVREEVNEEN